MEGAAGISWTDHAGGGILVRIEAPTCSPGKSRTKIDASNGAACRILAKISATHRAKTAKLKATSALDQPRLRILVATDASD